MQRLSIMSERNVFITVKNLDRGSYVEKCTRCDVCMHGTMDRNMDNCPIVKRIASDVTKTSYSIEESKLNIITATYDHDFRRALSVVSQAIDARCCHKR